MTALPGGASAFSVSDGSLCLRGPWVGGNAVTAGLDPGMIASFARPNGTGLEVGFAAPGSATASDSHGNPVQVHAVEGSTLLVWAAVLR